MSVEWWLLCAPVGEAAPPSINVWVCQNCGHWTANSYFDRNPSNPDWRPRCKAKDGCSRPFMEPFVYNRDDFKATENAA